MKGEYVIITVILQKMTNVAKSGLVLNVENKGLHEEFM